MTDNYFTTTSERTKYVTVHAEDTKGMDSMEVLEFHKVNPNGYLEKKMNLDAKIEEFIKAGTVPEGWRSEYGCGNRFVWQVLEDLTAKIKMPMRIMKISLQVIEGHLEMVESMVKKAEKY